MLRFVFSIVALLFVSSVTQAGSLPERSDFPIDNKVFSMMLFSSGESHDHHMMGECFKPTNGRWSLSMVRPRTSFTFKNNSLSVPVKCGVAYEIARRFIREGFFKEVYQLSSKGSKPLETPEGKALQKKLRKKFVRSVIESNSITSR